MTEEEKRLQEEQQRNAETMDRAIAYARSVGYGVDGQQAPVTQPEQPVTQPTTLPNAQNGADVLNLNATAVNQPEQPAVDTTPAQADTQPQQQPAPEESPYERFRREDADEWQKVMNGQKALLDYWVERDKQAQQRVKEAEEEDRRRTEMENRRAGLVGAGEVAASLINLFSVGGLHASNQVYKDYAQDWMRKADADRKYRQMRIDQLRDRQRGIGDKMEGMRASVTREAYERYRQQAAADAAEAQREAERQRAEEAAQAKRDADMQTKGFVPDPNSETGYRFDPNLAREMAFAKSTKTARTTSSTSPASAQKPATTQPAASTPNANDYSSYAVKPSSGTTQPSSNPASTSSSSQTRQQSGGSGRRAGRGRTTFLPPTQEDWERGIDLKNSPQGRKKIEPENKDDWSQYKVK